MTNHWILLVGHQKSSWRWETIPWGIGTIRRRRRAEKWSGCLYW